MATLSKYWTHQWLPHRNALSLNKQAHTHRRCVKRMGTVAQHSLATVRQTPWCDGRPVYLHCFPSVFSCFVFVHGQPAHKQTGFRLASAETWRGGDDCICFVFFENAEFKGWKYGFSDRNTSWTGIFLMWSLWSFLGLTAGHIVKHSVWILTIIWMCPCS